MTFLPYINKVRKMKKVEIFIRIFLFFTAYSIRFTAYAFAYFKEVFYVLVTSLSKTDYLCDFNTDCLFLNCECQQNSPSTIRLKYVVKRWYARPCFSGPRNVSIKKSSHFPSIVHPEIIFPKKLGKVISSHQ